MQFVHKMAAQSAKAEPKLSAQTLAKLAQTFGVSQKASAPAAPAAPPNPTMEQIREHGGGVLGFIRARRAIEARNQ